MIQTPEELTHNRDLYKALFLLVLEELETLRPGYTAALAELVEGMRVKK